MTILDDVFGLLQDYRAADRRQRPHVLHIGVHWYMRMVRDYDEYVSAGGILPVMDKGRVTVFGMYIEIEHSIGPWAWVI